MLKGILAFIGLGTVGWFAWHEYKKVETDANPENDTAAAMYDKIHGEWVPQLPIDSRSIPSNEGIYNPASITKRYGDGIVLARNQDYFNPAMLVASTGPNTLAPYATGNTKTLRDSGVVSYVI